MTAHGNLPHSFFETRYKKKRPTSKPGFSDEKDVHLSNALSVCTSVQIPPLPPLRTSLLRIFSSIVFLRIQTFSISSSSSSSSPGSSQSSPLTDTQAYISGFRPLPRRRPLAFCFPVANAHLHIHSLPPRFHRLVFVAQLRHLQWRILAVRIFVVGGAPHGIRFCLVDI